MADRRRLRDAQTRRRLRHSLLVAQGGPPDGAARRSGETYKPVGKGAYECGKLARYLKDVLEGALAVPPFAGNDKLVFEFLQGLSATDKQTLWRTARWYNHLVELTL